MVNNFHIDAFHKLMKRIFKLLGSISDMMYKSSEISWLQSSLVSSWRLPYRVMKFVTIFSVMVTWMLHNGTDSQPVNITTLFTGNFCPSLICYFSSKYVVEKMKIKEWPSKMITVITEVSIIVLCQENVTFCLILPLHQVMYVGEILKMAHGLSPNCAKFCRRIH